MMSKAEIRIINVLSMAARKIEKRIEEYEKDNRSYNYYKALDPAHNIIIELNKQRVHIKELKDANNMVSDEFESKISDLRKKCIELESYILNLGSSAKHAV